MSESPQGRLILSIDHMDRQEFIKFVREGDAFVVLMLGLNVCHGRGSLGDSDREGAISFLP
jgi:predicted component of type VI protein secretion system